MVSCKNCIPPKRTPTCHCTCEKYKNEVAELKAHRKENACSDAVSTLVDAAIRRSRGMYHGHRIYR